MYFDTLTFCFINFTRIKSVCFLLVIYMKIINKTAKIVSYGTISFNFTYRNLNST